MRFIKYFVAILILTHSGLIIAQGDDIERPKAIKIGLTHAPPMILLSADKAPEGMVVDFINEVAIREKWNIDWVTGPWSEVYDKALNKEIDVMTYIAFSEERTKVFDFSYESFVTGWGQVYTYDNTQFQSVLDFENKKIAVVRGDIHALGVTELCTKFKVNCIIKYVNNYDVAFKMLENKEVDGAVCGSTVGVTYEEKFNISRTSIMYHPTNALFATPKNTNSYILETFDQYLLKWRNDPSSPYSLSRSKWMNTIQSTVTPIWIKYLVIVILGLLIIFSFVVVFLRKQVRKHVAQHIHQSNQLKQIINLVPHMIYVVNSDGNVVLVNNYASEHFGVSSSSNTSKHQLLEKVPLYSKLFEDDSSLLKSGSGLIHKEIETTNFNNEKIIFSVSKVPFDSNDNLPSVLTVGVDVTEEKAHQKQIRYMAEHDDLTGLPNRQLLKESINLSIKNSKNTGLQCAVLFIDLDFFKNINDSLGHAAGDELLIVVTRRLQSLLDIEDMVARIGGDEFIVQLCGISAEFSETENHANKIATQILESLTQKIIINQQELYISASIGVVIYPKAALTYEQIMQRADIAMYQAKSLGRNGFVLFKQEMENTVLKRLTLVAELRKAIDNSEFIIEYQPQISGANETIIGLEALIRWKHPNGELILPNDFISVSEESGLIIPIGQWVLEEVCKQINVWMKKYTDIPFVTVNLSVIQIHSDYLVENLQELFQKYSVPAHLIELEVTETVMVEQVEKTVYTLSQLKNLGVRLSIDDFGTGYSSLSYLKKLPFDKLKIDYSFIKDIVTDSETQTIVKTIIGMTQDLSLEVIAEGVETENQLQMLLKMGCDNFQGFYFDKPNSAAYIEDKYLKLITK